VRTPHVRAPSRPACLSRVQGLSLLCRASICSKWQSTRWLDNCTTASFAHLTMPIARLQCRCRLQTPGRCTVAPRAAGSCQLQLRTESCDQRFRSSAASLRVVVFVLWQSAAQSAKACTAFNSVLCTAWTLSPLRSALRRLTCRHHLVYQAYSAVFCILVLSSGFAESPCASLSANQGSTARVAALWSY
jgi:hypothetical protein